MSADTKASEPPILIERDGAVENSPQHTPELDTRIERIFSSYREAVPIWEALDGQRAYSILSKLRDLELIDVNYQERMEQFEELKRIESGDLETTSPTAGRP